LSGILQVLLLAAYHVAQAPARFRSTGQDTLRHFPFEAFCGNRTSPENLLSEIDPIIAAAEIQLS
jgi:hypothetical protein